MAFNITLGFPRSAGTGPIAGVVVHRYQLQDALSELFEVALEIASTDATLDFHSVIGESIVLGFPDDPGQPQIQGIVKSVQQLSSMVASTGNQAASGYKLLIVPPVWLTTRRRDHRLFEKKNVAQIVAEVLAGYGSRIPAPALRLSKPPQIRDYVVQYGETDWEFITRILATDFITTFFDHPSQSAFTLVDDTSKMTTAPAAPTLFLPPSNLTSPPPHVFNVVLASNIETSTATVGDHDYEHPQLDLAGTNSAAPADGLFEGEADLEAFTFDIDEFADNAAGKERAGHLLESLRSRARTFTLDANFTVGPGQQITVVNHPRADVNATFLVLRARVVLEDGAARALGPTPTATASFVLECIPAAQPFLPVARPKPRIHGTQTGTIVGGADGDVVADSMSRVHVLFKWERQKLASKKTRPVRVSQAWAGTAYGFFVLPRVGDEVVVAYLDGDPDEPIIVGRVHNGARVNPVDPEGQEGIEKTISKWRSQTVGDPSGFNEILMDDLQAKERLELHAQRDYKSTVEHDAVTLVKHDDALTVGNNKTDKIKKAYSMQAGSVSISCGPYKLGAKTVDVTASEWVSIHAEGNMFLVAGDTTTIDAAEVAVTAGKITLTAGGSSIELSDSGITIKGPSVTITADGTVDVNGALITLN
jgi:type VI secretion system secreted protein VgrG